MIQVPGLSLEQAPPISAPFRFFLTAPIFGLTAAVALLFAGSDALSQRWTPSTLALTHLLTLGFITMSMMGALLQMMPVVAGSPTWHPRFTSTMVHLLLCLGVLALGCGLGFNNVPCMWAGLSLLAAAVLIFLLVISWSLARSCVHNATVSGMRLAILCLAVALAFGLRIGAEHIWQFENHHVHSWTDVHLAWALIGWIGLLVIGIAYEVVPMFQLTPPYPSWLQEWLGRSILAALLAWSYLFLHFGIHWSVKLFGLYLAFALTLFGAITLRLQALRRRRRMDATVLFWRTGMLCLIASSLLWLGGQFLPALAAWPRYELLLGSLFIVGFAVSVVNGMLYKIVPFLVWFHLQSRFLHQSGLPSVRDIIPERDKGRQLLAHLCALPVLVAATIWPPGLTYAAAILFAVSFSLLAAILIAAGRMYLQTAAALED